MTTEIPLWTAVLLGLGGGGIAGLLTLAGVLLKGIFDRRTAVEVNRLEQTKLLDGWFREGLSLARTTGNPAAVDQGYALLSALASRPDGVTPTHAELIAETVTRLEIGPTLAARAEALRSGEQVEFYLSDEEEG